MASEIHGQDNPLDKHRWKNRVLLLITESETNSIYLNQLEALGDLDSDFDERRLLVIDVKRDRYRIRKQKSLKKNFSNWILNSSLYEKYAAKAVQFNIVLIGLDGSVKLKQADILLRNELFNSIDAMPMRMAELKNKN